MEWTVSNQQEHDRIVHNLRSGGWSREDAREEADRLMSERLKRRATLEELEKVKGVLAHSLEGTLRIRQQGNHGTFGVVEIRSHLFPGDWTYCVWRSLPIDKAWDLFHGQCQHRPQYTQPVVQPGE